MRRPVPPALSLLGLLALGLFPSGAAASPQGSGAASSAIDGNLLLEHVKVLASDEFEGRAPGTRGETLTVAYVSEQLRKIGIQPGNPDGAWVQKVPLVGLTVEPAPALVFRKGDTVRRLAWRDD
jgi:hypothetical protein